MRKLLTSSNDLSFCIIDLMKNLKSRGKVNSVAYPIQI